MEMFWVIVIVMFLFLLSGVRCIPEPERPNLTLNTPKRRNPYYEMAEIAHWKKISRSHREKLIVDEEGLLEVMGDPAFFLNSYREHTNKNLYGVINNKKVILQSGSRPKGGSR